MNTTGNYIADRDFINPISPDFIGDHDYDEDIVYCEYCYQNQSPENMILIQIRDNKPEYMCCYCVLGSLQEDPQSLKVVDDQVTWICPVCNAFGSQDDLMPCGGFTMECCPCGNHEIIRVN